MPPTGPTLPRAPKVRAAASPPRGDIACFLDANGQLCEVKRLDLQALQNIYAGNMPLLCAAFSKWRNGKDPPVRVSEHFEHATASSALWKACGEAGVFNPSNTVRGVGAGTDDDGGLIYHLGDRVLWGNEVLSPGRIDR